MEESFMPTNNKYARKISPRGKWITRLPYGIMANYICLPVGQHTIDPPLGNKKEHAQEISPIEADLTMEGNYCSVYNH